TTDTHNLSLHDALPIYGAEDRDLRARADPHGREEPAAPDPRPPVERAPPEPRPPAPGHPPARLRPARSAERVQAGGVRPVRGHRSEEHTSELQSRENLV